MKISDLFPIKKIRAEVADTPSKQERGLMFRTKIAENEGMIFLFKASSKLTFWGENTYVPLDIAFVSDENKIVEISSISPMSRRAVKSQKECKIAIEANFGFFKKNKIKVGDKVYFSEKNKEENKIDIEFKGEEK